MASVFASLIALLYIVKQLLLDVAGMLTGNISVVLNTTVQLMGELAGMIFDIERILEKVIVLLGS